MVEQRGDPRAKVKGRKRWRGRAGSAVTIKGSGSESKTMLAHRLFFHFRHRKTAVHSGAKGKGTRCCTGSAGLQRTSPGPAIGLLFGLLAPVQRPPYHRLVPSLWSQTHQRSRNKIKFYLKWLWNSRRAAGGGPGLPPAFAASSPPQQLASFPL